MITPTSNADYLDFGKIKDVPSYQFADGSDGCQYKHIKFVEFEKQTLELDDNASNLAKVKVFVQAKRYKLGSKINAGTVRQLRQAIPFGGQGAFITTADFQKSANEVALEAGFPRIGLVNGRQLVDLLIEHWSNIPSDFQERLGLKPGLVKI